MSDAGYGELLVEINNGFNQLPVRIVRQGKVFTVHTQAKECGTYNVFIKWNGEDITGKFYGLKNLNPTKFVSWCLCCLFFDWLRIGRTELF